MKKVTLTLAAVATIVCLASCKKTCTCTTYVGTTSAETEVSLDDLKTTYSDISKCSDVNTVIDLGGIKTGMECK